MTPIFTILLLPSAIHSKLQSADALTTGHRLSVTLSSTEADVQPSHAGCCTTLPGTWRTANLNTQPAHTAFSEAQFSTLTTSLQQPRLMSGTSTVTFRECLGGL